MPSIKLASTRLSTGSGGGKVSPTYLSASAAQRITPGRVSAQSIRAPQVNANAANVRWQNMPVQRMMTDTVTNALNSGANFAQTANNAALQYREREDKFYAQETSMKYSDDMRKAFYGYTDENGQQVPGYANTKLGEATATHGQFQDMVNESYAKALENLNPRARQKALMTMAAERDSLLNKASVHRTSQFTKAEEAQRYEKKRQATLSLSMDPNGMYNKDPVTGLTGKQKFYNEFTSLEQADKEWYKLVSDVGEKIYVEKGFAAAKEYYQGTGQVDAQGNRIPGIGEVELASSPAHSASMLSNIMKWENETIRATNSQRELAFKYEQRAIKETKDRNFGKLISNLANGELTPKSEVAEMVENGVLGVNESRVYYQDAFGEYDSLPDPTSLRVWEERLRGSASNNFEYTRADGTTGTWKYEHQKDSSLDSAGRSFLLKLQQDLQNPTYRGNYSRGSDTIDGWMKGAFWEAGIYDQEKEIRVNNSKRELHSRLSGGEDYDTVIDDMKKRYDTPYVRYSRLPRLSNGARPQSLNDVRNQRDNLVKLYNGGNSKMPKAVYEADKRNLIEYAKSLSVIGELTPDPATVKGAN